MNDPRTITCPSCAGPTDLANRFVQLVVCSYCSQTIVLTRDGVQAGGKSAALADLFTELSTGSAGELDGRPFSVLGRVRFDYDDGFWDEWYIGWVDGETAWLHEDEGELSLVSSVDTAPVDFDAAAVGHRLPVGSYSVYVKERRTATVFGAEGQLPRQIRPGVTLEYVDGHADGTIVMIERIQGQVEVFTGARLDDDALQVHG